MTVIKSSINASKVMRYVDNIPQKQLADLLLTSRPNVSHMQTGRRRMQQDIATSALNNVQSNLFKLALTHEFSELIPDVFDGPAINKNSLSYLVMYEQEANEFSANIDEIMRIFVKPASQLTQGERLTARDGLKELIDALGWGYNLLFYASDYLNIDAHKLISEQDESWKMKKWI
ncbi:hypothetical protein F1J25_03795 [Listeria monocytogenes]|uniref:Uncharacterized protein n=1 Tax=Listeria monocytogenes TaxID=1639 RepID=A0A464VFR9_LISMN|nr:hypothetical protein [Listeria monocytogenes]EAG6288749.1 hypothetical protein [Listeria monocytogenes CFSAN003825]EAG6316003.1 hypothetical protein [Listeria monocytogenes CFSAN003824]EKM0360392.1 hypothetical protein [Listeria innocua]MBS9361659.1 hypothetical protein [Listeria welshimeri]AKG88259.1 hypothetical protein CY94_06685 [Listeria monocytogenes]